MSAVSTTLSFAWRTSTESTTIIAGSSARNVERQKSQCHSPLVSCVSWVDPQLTQRWGASPGSCPSSTGSAGVAGGSAGVPASADELGDPDASGTLGSSGVGEFSSGVTRAGYRASSALSTPPWILGGSSPT